MQETGQILLKIESNSGLMQDDNEPVGSLKSSQLQSISILKAGGPHASEGKREEVNTPLTNQAINHLAVTAKITHSDWKFAEFTSLCKLLCCRFLV